MKAVLLKNGSSVKCRWISEDLRFWLRCCWRFEIVTTISPNILCSDCVVLNMWIYGSGVTEGSSTVSLQTFSWIVLTYKHRPIFTSGHDMTWHDMTWHDMTWHDMTWHDITSLKHLFLSTYLLGYLTALFQRQNVSHNDDSDDIINLSKYILYSVDCVDWLTDWLVFYQLIDWIIAEWMTDWMIGWFIRYRWLLCAWKYFNSSCNCWLIWMVHPEPR
jgi:hypothetical protein